MNHLRENIGRQLFDMPSQNTSSQGVFARHALLPDGWHRNVTLKWDDKGQLLSVVTDSQPEATLPIATGPIVPGMPNLHSHAFQRAMAGLTETRGDPSDSFWSWRTLMYRFAERFGPKQLLAISRHLYIEMLKAGYTSVCEFHYVHHAISGKPYANPAEHAEQIIHAAQDAGIGMTLLPVLYEHSGFGEQAPLARQARFISSAQWLLDLLAQLRRSHPMHGALQYGAAPHSLRAVSAQSLRTLVEELHRVDPHAPLHIHIAEQTKEVDDCLQVFGQRPVQRLFELQDVDARWCLVHATHMSVDEYEMTARSGATVGLCPTTEANLGDGFFDAVRYLQDGGKWGIGSDSNISVCPRSELRLLEYGQRLLHRSRNVLASAGQAAVADNLYQQAVRGGANATGRPVQGLRKGQRADFIVLDEEHTSLVGREPALFLSGVVFAEHGGTPIRDVYVGGQAVVKSGRHEQQEEALMDYRRALAELLS